jgi:hypothetical protein
LIGWPHVVAPVVFVVLAGGLAFFASVFTPSVLADPTASTFLAIALAPVMLADFVASAFLASALALAMFADQTASAFLAIALAPAVFAHFVIFDATQDLPEGFWVVFEVHFRGVLLLACESSHALLALRCGLVVAE